MLTRNLEDTKYAKDIALIHLQTFPGFFLTFLGKGFLNQLYRGFITHEKSSVIGAFDHDERLVGFVAYSEDISGFYNYLIKQSFFSLAWYSLIATFKKPNSVFRLLRAFTYSGDSKRNEPYIDLSSIGVLPVSNNQGVGSLLINALKDAVWDKPYAYIKLETDRNDNDGANAFYVKNGFILDNCFTTREGREMNEYRYLLG